MKLIKNGTIYTMNKNDEIIENGCILIDNGKIKNVASNIDETHDMEVIDVNGANIYPGFVEAHSHVGLSEDSVGAVGKDHNEITDPLVPHLRTIDGVYPQDITLKEAYEKGVTSAVICPGSSNILGGSCTAIKLYGKRIDKMIIKDNVGIKTAFGENPKNRYGNKGKTPATRMAISALLRDMLFKTIEYKNEKELALKEGTKLPSHDMKLEALIPVINKEIPLKAHVHRDDDIFTAIRIAKEFDINLTLDHCTSGWMVADEIAESNKPAIVGPSLGHRGKPELKDKSFKAPKVLHEAGVKIAITTDSPVIPLHYLPLCAGLAAAEGLDEYEALKAITINPAEIVGIDDRVGSLEIGKDADMVVCLGNPIKEINYKVVTTIINGEQVYQI